MNKACFLGSAASEKSLHGERMIVSHRAVSAILLVLAANSHLSCSNKRDLSAGQEKSALMDALVASYFDPSRKGSQPIAGMSLAVFQGNEPILVKGYGYADYDQKVPAKPDTIFRIGSITKQFTAAGIMALVEDGLLNLDDPIQTVLPEIPSPDHSVSIRHLLTHTSGIVNYTTLPEWRDLSNRPMSRVELAHIFADRPLEFRPGDKFSYSNSNYYLLGMVIEKVSGLSYEDFIQQRLVTAAQLKNTRYCRPEQNYPLAAQGYMIDDAGRMVQADPLIMDHAFASGALCSTVLDLVQWTKALAKGQVIRPETYELMSTPFTPRNDASPTKHGYGFGLGIGEEFGHRYIGHGGSINGFASLLDYYPADEMVIVILVNTETSVPDELGVRVARVGLGLDDARKN